MKIQISYSACYRYERPVSFSPLLLRILPRTDWQTRAIRSILRVDPTADLQYRRDLFSNDYVSCFFDLEARQELRVEAEFELETSERNPFHFLLEARATSFPFAYSSHELRILAPYLSEETASLDLPFWKPTTGEGTIPTLVSLLEALHKNICYEYREDGPARAPLETIARGSGACRDSAVLLAAVLTGFGLAARVVSGFLTEFDVASKKRVADGAMHAWCEVFLPGAGWVGLDGTNGVFCDHCYLPCAVGLTMDDVAPLQGSYYDKERVASVLTSTIRLTLLQ